MIKNNIFLTTVAMIWQKLEPIQTLKSLIKILQKWKFFLEIYYEKIFQIMPPIKKNKNIGGDWGGEASVLKIFQNLAFICLTVHIIFWIYSKIHLENE